MQNLIADLGEAYKHFMDEIPNINTLC